MALYHRVFKLGSFWFAVGGWLWRTIALPALSRRIPLGSRAKQSDNRDMKNDSFFDGRDGT